MRTVSKTIAIGLIMGMLYFTLEGIWRIRTNGGWANIVMLPVGGFCGVLAGRLHRSRAFSHLRLWEQSVFCAAAILSVEFFSGCVFNLWLGLSVWDYSGCPLNLFGQVCLPFALLWFLMAPFVFWTYDMLCSLLWHEERPGSVARQYARLFLLR